VGAFLCGSAGIACVVSESKRIDFKNTTLRTQVQHLFDEQRNYFSYKLLHLNGAGRAARTRVDGAGPQRPSHRDQSARALT
jgi:hypothetical protein